MSSLVVGGDNLDQTTMVDEVLDQGQPDQVENPNEDMVVDDVNNDAPPSDQVENEPEEQEVTGEPKELSAEEEAAKKGFGSGAQKRIKNLVAEKHKLQETLSTIQQQYMYQMQQQQQQLADVYQKQISEQQKQTELLHKQLQMLTERKEEEDPNISPMERYKKQLLKEAQLLAKEQMGPEIAALRSQFEAERQQRAAMEQQAQTQQKLQSFTAMTKQATSQYLLKDLDVKSKSELGETFDDMLLSYVASTGLEPNQAAMQFSRVLDKYHRARLANPVKSAQVRKSQSIPSVPTGTTNAAGGDYRPSWDALKANGFNGYTEWRNAGASRLREPNNKR